MLQMSVALVRKLQNVKIHFLPNAYEVSCRIRVVRD